MGKTGGFQTLEAWIEARAFRMQVSDVAKTFPSFEQFSLTKQIVNSARSVHANIAEGYGRFHYKETTKHCRIARGSLEETLDHLICARDEKYITQEKLDELELKYNRCHRLLNGYISYIERMDKNKAKSPNSSLLKTRLTLNPVSFPVPRSPFPVPRTPLPKLAPYPDSPHSVARSR